MEDCFGIVRQRIQRPSIWSWLTALKRWDPPHTCMSANVLALIGRTAPMDSGIQSIWDFIAPVVAPCDACKKVLDTCASNT